jgi:hypothetical protein
MDRKRDRDHANDAAEPGEAAVDHWFCSTETLPSIWNFRSLT